MKKIILLVLLTILFAAKGVAHPKPCIKEVQTVKESVRPKPPVILSETSSLDIKMGPIEVPPVEIEPLEIKADPVEIKLETEPVEVKVIPVKISPVEVVPVEIKISPVEVSPLEVKMDPIEVKVEIKVDQAVRECPMRKEFFRELKYGEKYFVTEYVKGVDDAEDLTPETVVFLKPANT